MVAYSKADAHMFGPAVCQYINEMDVLPLIDPMSQTPAQVVRNKLLSDLNDEERTWMSMDRIINPELYADKMMHELSEDESSEDEDEVIEDNGTSGGALCAAQSCGTICMLTT
jgi:hypothetical protein